MQKYNVKWSEEETILAYYYYCQIPFGKIAHKNPQIIEIAGLLGRTPSSVAMKMANLAHFDPEQQNRNISGMKNASKLDKKVIQEFIDNWEELSYRAALIEKRLRLISNTMSSSETCFPEGEDVLRIDKQRINQDFFRNTILTAYGNRCCIAVSFPITNIS